MEEQSPNINVKKNKIQKIIIYILLVVFVILIGLLVFYLINKDNFKKEEENPNETPNPEPSLEMNASYFENLLSEQINVSYLENGFSNIDELENQEKLYLLFYGRYSYLESMDTIDIVQVDEYFKNNYNTTVDHENILCPDSENEEYCYLFDEESNTYLESFESDARKESILSTYNKRNVYSRTIDYIQENDSYTLTTYGLYTSPCYNNCEMNTAYFSNVKDANQNENAIITTESSYTEEEIISFNNNRLYQLILESNFEIYRELMASNTYIFERIDDNFVLVSYQINGLDKI